jgi:LysR family pca operon transcriptional activator
VSIIAYIELYLGTFLEVARRRNISRAADALVLSQTAVSRRVRALELQVGARLFERSGKGVKLTATGEVFLEHAVRITDATRLALIETARSAPADERLSPKRPGKRGRKKPPALL